MCGCGRTTSCPSRTPLRARRRHGRPRSPRPSGHRHTPCSLLPVVGAPFLNGQLNSHSCSGCMDPQIGVLVSISQCGLGSQLTGMRPCTAGAQGQGDSMSCQWWEAVSGHVQIKGYNCLLRVLTASRLTGVAHLCMLVVSAWGWQNQPQ